MSKKTLIATAVGTAFVSSLAVAPVASAAGNPFGLSSLASGYQVADNTPAKPMEGRCGGMKAGEGKCGGVKAGEGKCGMSMADTNKDGKISKEEAAKHQEVMFNLMDTNKDGFIDQTEMGKMRNGMCGAYQAKVPEGKSGGTK
jgi:uncharacterized low-complexity protein